jgi:membrane protein
MVDAGVVTADSYSGGIMKASKWMQQMGALRGKLRKASVFMQRGIWDIDLRALPAWRSVGVRMLRIVSLVIKGFRDDECSMHASALTFSSLMSIVPILALMLSMARGLGDADTAKNWLQDRIRDWTETFQVAEFPEENRGAVEQGAGGSGGVVLPPAAAGSGWDEQHALAQRINNMVEAGFERVDQINFAKLGTVGLVLLIWMVIEVLGRVERSFNRVWGIARGRSIWRRFTDYISVLLILPILVAAAASVPVVELITSHMPDETAAYLHRLVESGFFKNLVVIGMTTLTFTFVLMFMPNTSMRLSSGLTGGFMAAILFLAWLWICAMVQVGAAKYGRIYGSFALVPIILAWVHVSWQIVLFGAEVAFSVENAMTYRMEQSADDASIAARLTLAVLILREAGLALHGDATPFEVGRFVEQRRVPVRFVNAVMEELVQAGYLAPLAERTDVYVLLRAADSLRMRELLHTMLHAGADTAVLGLHAGQLEPGVVDAVSKALGAAEDELERITVASLLAKTT